MRLLPYIDQEPLWRSTDQAFKQSSFIGDNPPHIGLNTVLPVYTCPADERTFYPQKTPPTGIQVALSSYLGVAGTDFETEDGMLFTDSAVQLSEVTDGASNTLLVVSAPQRRFAVWLVVRRLGPRYERLLRHVLGCPREKCFSRA